MAIVQNPITGRSSGTYAGAVFATQFGKNVLRSKPVSVSVSQSDASKLARQKFKALAAAVKELMPALSLFFTSKDFGMPVFSYMIKQAYHTAVSGTLNNVVVDNSKLLVAQDSLGMGQYFHQDQYAGESLISIDQPAVTNLIGADNTIIIACYNATTGKLVSVITDVPSNSAGHTFTSTLVGVDDDIKIYAKPAKTVRSKGSSEFALAIGTPV